MRFGVLGTGTVGTTIATKLVGLGHEVTVGARQAGNEKAAAWAASAGDNARHGTFRDTAAFGEVVVSATNGGHAVAALRGAGGDNLSGKLLIDVTNPLDFSAGFPPTLAVCNTDSLGEQIQRAFPAARVVKTLNTVNAFVMVNPSLIPGGSSIFLSGNDTGAKQETAGILREFGWSDNDIVDLGDIKTARGPEMLVPLWLRLFGVFGQVPFSIRVVRGT